MPHTYIQDAKGIIDALCRDKGLVLEEKLILLGMVTDFVTEVTKKLEDDLAVCNDGLVH